MTALPTNCFTIASSNPLTEIVPVGEGVQKTTFSGASVVRLGVACVIPLGTSPGKNMPECDNVHMLRAKLLRDGTERTRPRLVAAGPETRSIIVQVTCADLRFEFEPIAEKLNLWPGGDGDIIPIAQFGSHKDGQNKVQLFELLPGESIFVVDQHGAMAQMRCIECKPVFSRPGIPDLVELLVMRAKAQNSVRSFDWAIHNLAALGLNGPFGTLIRNKRGGLERLRNEMAEVAAQ